MDNSMESLSLLREFQGGEVLLRSANKDDLPNLRQWKNAQKAYFFYQSDISESQQREWFAAYQQRPDDLMFMVCVDGRAIGCMGIRLRGEVWDVYNVILGVTERGGKGYMGAAFQAMLHFALERHLKPVTLQVLKHNPAVSWYEKNGFVMTSEQSDYFCMRFDAEKIEGKAL